VFEGVELGRKLSKEDYESELPRLREALLEVQGRLQDSDHAVVVVIAGAEGSGKGETVNTLAEWMDARGITVHGVGEPSAEESERPAFYRFWRRLPPKGAMAVFFGSWYTQPIVEKSFDRIDEHAMEDALRAVTSFERMLVEENVILVKLWLHVSKEGQARRFEKLEADPDTAWRVTPRDWEYHETYDRFIEASSLALRRTDTAFAPWHLVDAAHRRFRDITVGRTLLSEIERGLDAAVVDEAPEPLPQPAEVNVLSQLDHEVRIDRERYRSRLAEHQGRLARLARRLGSHERSAVVVFEGADAAGKGGCIRRIVQVLDARFYRVIPVAAPTDEEKARPYLWRFWRKLPRRGEVVVFDRSWYGRVLVERIEGFCPPSAWRRAYGEINDFEEQLVDAGVLVFKFWLAITPEEQLRRFEEREQVVYKRYKLTSEDWRNRDKWAAYEAAACEMFDRTSTEIAPWHPIASTDKHHARIRVLEILCEGLERALGPDEKPRAKKRKKRRG
jgi:polyphosphate:AMP phosphotransferase